MTELEKIVRSLPSEVPFEFTMPADTTNEMIVDIPTRLDADEAWHLVGCEFDYQSIDPTVPYRGGASASLARELQIHRSNASALLLPFNHPDLMFYNHTDFSVYSAASVNMIESQKLLVGQAVTRSQVIRMIWRTSVDDTTLAATQCLRGKLKYHLISAPNDGRTKMGIPLDEI